MPADRATPPPVTGKSGGLLTTLLTVFATACVGALLLGAGGFYLGALLGFAGALLWRQHQEIAALKTQVQTLWEQSPLWQRPPAWERSPHREDAPRRSGLQTANEEDASDDSSLHTAMESAEGEDHRALESAPTARDDDRGLETAPTGGENIRGLEGAPAAITAAVRRLFTGGNLVVRLGVVVLFFGVAFLLRYAYDNALLPLELRLAGTALGGLALTALGWRLRERTDTYGLVLQGAGVGLLYLSIFAAARLYGLLPLPAAFAMLVVLVAGSSLLAVVQNAQSLAVFAMSGGFLAPVLMSTGEGSHVALFSYYALLNAGILAMAWFRFWRWLNWVGFLFTFVIGAAWGRQYYRPELLASTEPFLILFFLYYLGVTVLFARRQSPNIRGLVDGTLVFGTPMAAFALQWGLVREQPFAMAYSSLAAAAIYVLLAWWLKRRGAMTHLLGQSFLALGLVFATLAVPFAFDDQRWTSAIWALEGAGLVWVGLRQAQLLPRLAGMGLALAAAGAYLNEWSPGPSAGVLDGDVMGAALLGLAGALVSWLTSVSDTPRHRLERMLRWPFLYWGGLWWVFAGALAVSRVSTDAPSWNSNLHEHLLVSFLTVSTLGLAWLSRRLHWQEALTPTLALLPALAAILAGLDRDWQQASPLTDLGWLAWPLGLAAVYGHLAARDALGGPTVFRPRVDALWHAGSWWLLAMFAAWTTAALLARFGLGSGWIAAAWGAVPGLLAAVLAIRAGRTTRWPFGDHRGSYTGWGHNVMLVALLAWLLLTALGPGSPAPLPYVVLANPLELTQLGILVLAARQIRASRRDDRDAGWLALGVVAFLWLNLVAARAVHSYGGVGYPLPVIIGSDAFQTAASVLWTVTALILMVLGARRLERGLWIAGAVVLGLAIVKLFTLDLSRLDVLARIVSFITVGALMLIIGYFAPLPPVGRPQPAAARPADAGEAA